MMHGQKNIKTDNQMATETYNKMLMAWNLCTLK